MKRALQILIILTLLLGSTAFGSLAGTPPPYSIFLPINHGGSYTLAGHILNSNNQPISGVKVVDSHGNTDTTDSSGLYAMSANSGNNALAPSMEGYNFSPSMIDAKLPGGSGPLNFTGVAACTEAIVNGGFEASGGWDFPETEHTGGTTTDGARTGTRSAKLGITDGVNEWSYSSARSGVIRVPTILDSAILSLWIYPVTSETATRPLPAAPVGPDFGNAVNQYDAQYVLVLDPGGDPASVLDDTLLETLLWVRSNSQVWTQYQFDLTKYAGRSIKIQVGAYNDGYDGITALYADDISLLICTNGGATPPPPTPTAPPPAGCTNQMGNSGFETTTSWGIPNTEYSAGYSTSLFRSGLRSMRTGILTAGANRFSYSDAYQVVNVPSNVSSAKLSMWIYSISGERASTLAPEFIPAAPTQPRFGNEVLFDDVQYVLVLDRFGNILEQLYWRLKNNQEWTYQEFDLNAYRGKRIRIQFGTYNNGSDGVSAMYVDDAYLNICGAGSATATPTPTTVPPTPTPIATVTPAPVGCTEQIRNGTMEGSAAWDIPITAFSAGYSTMQARSGSRSLRTGIIYGAHNRFSYSDGGQFVTIPNNATSATLTFWAYPQTGVSALAPIPDLPIGDIFALTAPSNDVQYLLILDAFENWIDTLVWQRSNAAAWTPYEFDMGLYANLHPGDTIKLQFGTFNDGLDGVTAMYVDDVSLVTCR